MNDDLLLIEIGQRLARRRLELGLTQTRLARQSGVGKRTVERLEAGHSTQMSNFVRILRVLGLQDDLLEIIPEVGPSPMDLLKLKGRERQRASSRRASTDVGDWTWDDDA